MDASAGTESFDYRIIPGLDRYDRLELHVFARAYADSWIALHKEAPRGRHWFEALGVAIDFYAPVIPG